jgi:hypothetical protein
MTRSHGRPKQLFPQESKARNTIANKDAHNSPQELPMLMGEKLIHSQMKVFPELRPGVSVIGVENGNAMLLKRAPSNPPWRYAPELVSFRLFSKGINVHAARKRVCHERWNRSRDHLGN